MIQAQATTREASISCDFLLGEDKYILGKLVEDIDNSYRKVLVQYHRNMTEAYKLLVNGKQYSRNMVQVVRYPGSDKKGKYNL